MVTASDDGTVPTISRSTDPMGQFAAVSVSRDQTGMNYELLSEAGQSPDVCLSCFRTKEYTWAVHGSTGSLGVNWMKGIQLAGSLSWVVWIVLSDPSGGLVTVS